MTTLTERMRAFGGLFGKMFGGSRNLYDVFGYSSYVTPEMLTNKYARQDIAARIVEAEPHATWAYPPELEGVTDEFSKAWDKMVTRFNLMDKFSRADKICGMARYSVLLVGYNDGVKVYQPVNTRRRNNEITYIQPYSEKNAEIVEWENDPQSPRFGMPKMYRISPADDAQTSAVGASINRRGSGQQLHKGFIVQPFQVHHSRILHIAENVLEDSVFGYPRLMRVFNLLEDLLKTVGGSSETFWLTSNRGLQVDVDKEMDFKAGDADALAAEIDEYMHNLTRVIRTKGVKINNLGSDVADPRGTFGVIVALLSGATGIPQRILLGSEAGQLASEQDRANWAGRITERRNLFAEPSIIAAFIKMQIENKALPPIEELENIVYMWPDAFHQNPLEEAQTNAQQARSLANVSKALSDSRPAVTLEEGRNIIGVKGVVPPELNEAAAEADQRERDLHERTMNPIEASEEDEDTDTDENVADEDVQTQPQTST